MLIVGRLIDSGRGDRSRATNEGEEERERGREGEGWVGGHVRMMCRENKNKSQLKSKSEF